MNLFEDIMNDEGVNSSIRKIPTFLEEQFDIDKIDEKGDSK
jgi:hypothetical protein